MNKINLKKLQLRTNNKLDLLQFPHLYSSVYKDVRCSAARGIVFKIYTIDFRSLLKRDKRSERK